jgi:hypothetical protein
MGRGNPVILATRSFATQLLATSHFKDMLGRYRPGDRVSDLDALDLAALLERHDEYAAKVGCGVLHFEVMLTEHRTPCFQIVRADGTGTDFSYGIASASVRPAASRKSAKLSGAWYAWTCITPAISRRHGDLCRNRRTDNA